ncbi:MAG: hypothetical protein EXS16_04910 [Gemmataceae bacterium]|nr:hypothetical protein [Gemmataceae bacterium]
MVRSFGFLACIAFCLTVPSAVLPQNKVARSATNEMVEKVLQGLDLKYQRNERKDKEAVIAYYDFKRGEQSYRLYNYVNDLWIESIHDKQIKIEEVNLWNATAKFTRLVQIDMKDKMSLSLESQIDCLGGITEAGIRQFVNRFDKEANDFSKFLAKR